jgi:hypothetical protein
MQDASSCDAGSEQADARREPKSSANSPRDFFFVNLFGLILIGLIVLVWIGLFTNYLDTVVALLGLGGILTWIAFLGKVVREERKKQLGMFLENTLMRQRTSVILIVVTALLIVLSLNIGCVVTDASGDTTARVVVVSPATRATRESSGNAATIWKKRLAPGTKLKLPVLTGPLGRTCRVMAEGLPGVERRVRPLRRSWLDVPGSFSFQNQILVRPSRVVSQTSAKAGHDHEVVVKVGSNEPVVMPYDGRAFWIGCRRSVAVPEALRERWRLDLLTALLKKDSDVHRSRTTAEGPISYVSSELRPSGAEIVLARWFNAEAVDPIPNLVTDQEVCVVVQNRRNGEPFATASGQVGLRHEEGLPQVLHLEKVPD